MNKQATLKSSGYRVAVLCGGESSEREVSIVSGKAVAAAVEALDLPCDLLVMERNCLPMKKLDPESHLVLPVIHGTYGEDGRLSCELDVHGFAYAGCDQASSVLCYDKLASKLIAERTGLPVADDLLLQPENTLTFDAVASELGVPFILKPRRDGSSVGLHLIRNESDFERAAEDLHRMEYLAEAYLEGVDLTVGLLSGEPLGVVGVRPEGGLYDYEHKYTTGMSRYDVPADIEEPLRDLLMEQSRQLFKVLGCRDLARVDYRLGLDGSYIFLEINTLPGMTPTSLLPKTASCSGMGFEELVLEWITIAFQRRQERSLS